METDFNERRQDPLLRVDFLQKEETAHVPLRSPSRHSRQHQGHLAYTVEEWFNLPAYVKTRVPCPVLLEAPQYMTGPSTFEERMRWLVVVARQIWTDRYGSESVDLREYES